MFSGREKKPGPVQALSAVVTERTKIAYFRSTKETYFLN